MSGELLFPILGDNWRISSGIGSRVSPGGIGSTNHVGTDIAAPLGTVVIAPTDLKIMSAGRAGGFGNLIQGTDASGNLYKFGHLSGFGVKAGQTVPAGTPIGKVGSTGNSTGNHLHYEVRDKAGKVVNALAKTAIGKGKDALTKGLKSIGGDAALAAANTLLPGSGAVLGAIGIGGSSPSLLEQFREWLASTGFFQRLALAFFAFILIGGAVLLMRGESIVNIAKGKIA